MCRWWFVLSAFINDAQWRWLTNIKQRLERFANIVREALRREGSATDWVNKKFAWGELPWERILFQKLFAFLLMQARAISKWLYPRTWQSEPKSLLAVQCEIPRQLLEGQYQLLVMPLCQCAVHRSLLCPWVRKDKAGQRHLVAQNLVGPWLRQVLVWTKGPCECWNTVLHWQSHSKPAFACKIILNGAL